MVNVIGRLARAESEEASLAAIRNLSVLDGGPE